MRAVGAAGAKTSSAHGLGAASLAATSLLLTLAAIAIAITYDALLSEEGEPLLSELAELVRHTATRRGGGVRAAGNMFAHNAVPRLAALVLTRARRGRSAHAAATSLALVLPLLLLMLRSRVVPPPDDKVGSAAGDRDIGDCSAHSREMTNHRGTSNETKKKRPKTMKAAARGWFGGMAAGSALPPPLLLSSEDPPLSAKDIERLSIFDALGLRMAPSLPLAAREARAVAWLRAGGLQASRWRRSFTCRAGENTISWETAVTKEDNVFCLCLQLYDADGNVTGDAREWVRAREPLARCSGGQRHLVQMLSQLASLASDCAISNTAAPPTTTARALVCDELLVSLDLPTQARMLLIVREIAHTRRAAVLYSTCMVEALELLCDEVRDECRVWLRGSPREGNDEALLGHGYLL